MADVRLSLDSTRTTDEMSAAGLEMALLPVGSTEQHSHHLPCCTDTAIADAICDGIASKLAIWRLPTLPISISHMHRGHAGSVWVTNETMLAMVKDIVLSVRMQGVKKVVIANFHGGNFILRPAVQDLNRDYDDLAVIMLEPTVDYSDIYETFSTMRHAEEAETSVMAAIAPELVHMDRAVDEVPAYSQSFLMYAPFKKLGEHGCWGNPECASADKGRRAIQRRVDASVGFIEETFANIDQIKGSQL